MNYLTKKLKEDIKNGGLVIAPSRAGKTTAILELLRESEDYIVIVPGALVRDEYFLRNRLLKLNIPNINEKVLLSRKFKTKFSRTKKIIVDGYFDIPCYDSCLNLIDFNDIHCAVSTAPVDMIIYNNKGKKFTIKREEMYGYERNENGKPVLIKRS